jgi:cell division protein FtsB
MFRYASRFLIIVLISLLSAVSTGLVIVWAQTQREYANFERKHQDTQERLTAMRAEREYKEAYLRAFLNEPEFVERVIRERMGYVEPGDIVFRFESPLR